MSDIGNIANWEGVRERATGAVTNIDSNHRYIHMGKLFESFIKTTIVAGGTYTIAIKTPLTKELHYTPSTIMPSADKLTMEFFEAGTYSGGTDVTVINHKRDGGVTETQAVKEGVTITTAGTKIAQIYLPGSTGVGQSRTGNTFGTAQNEMILKKDTVYLYKLTNGSSEPNTVQVNFFWYEEDDF